MSDVELTERERLAAEIMRELVRGWTNMTVVSKEGRREVRHCFMCDKECSHGDHLEHRYDCTLGKAEEWLRALDA